MKETRQERIGARMVVRAPTPFEQRVYGVISRIPAGRVSTYGLVAGAIGCGSARAVGQALRRNPFAPRVPCHRVIASDLTLGGFRGMRAGVERRAKRDLLAGEGVRFDGRGRLAELARLFRFDARPKAWRQ
jgi:methylated-DNA-[protein]-cysteine S-methyltransferase